MKQYLDMCQYILENGQDRDDRTGTGTRSVFGYQTRYDLTDGFPLLTTKKMFLRPPADDPFVVKYGELGPVYGRQWRNFNNEGVDQVAKLVDSLKNNPFSRRHIICAWNPAEVDEMALPPCHAFLQFYVSSDKKYLSCQLYQRSADTFLGVPFNIASYALFTSMLAQVCGYKPKEFVHTIGDAHIYKDHFDVVKEQISRTPYPKCQLVLNPEVKSIFDFTIDDIKIENYQSHGKLVGKVSV